MSEAKAQSSLRHPKEKERLAALKFLKILDTPAEARYDRITRLATQAFGIPIAYVSLIDENRQWLKSCQGMPACETSREASFCAHTILQDKPLVITNTLEDPRFAQNPRVIGPPYIRFYAGYPLLAQGKHPVGSLSLADFKPRGFSDNDSQLLQDLAAMVEHEFNLYSTLSMQNDMLRMQEELIASQDRLANELGEGARYVQSLLPPLIKHQTVQTDWAFYPSTQLGGDIFHYHWLDKDHFAFFLIDTAGHGLKAAFLSVSLLDSLRKVRGQHTFSLSDPAGVLFYLNRQFAMQDHGNQFFTIWYGVYKPGNHKLVFACGGHPQAVLRPGKTGSQLQLLGQNSFLLGVLPNATFSNQVCEVHPGDKLYLFTDGLYEAEDAAGQRSSVEEVASTLGALPKDSSASDIVKHIQSTRKIKSFADDVSLLVLHFT
jgi:sigma-B regulation protein RsbU (phosphoserine phosphatase)